MTISTITLLALLVSGALYLAIGWRMHRRASNLAGQAVVDGYFLQQIDDGQLERPRLGHGEPLLGRLAAHEHQGVGLDRGPEGRVLAVQPGDGLVARRVPGLDQHLATAQHGRRLRQQGQDLVGQRLAALLGDGGRRRAIAALLDLQREAVQRIAEQHGAAGKVGLAPAIAIEQFPGLLADRADAHAIQALSMRGQIVPGLRRGTAYGETSHNSIPNWLAVA